MRYVLCMYTREHFANVERNPEFAHVCVIDGKVWMSQEVLDEIEDFTGRRPATECPRELTAFLHEQGRLLKGRTPSEELARRNFIGYCLLRGVEHALSLRMHGVEYAGAMPAMEVLYDAFHSDGIAPHLRMQ